MIAATLRAERFKEIEDARAIIAVENPSAEDFAKFDEIMAHTDRLREQIDRVEKAQALSAEMGEVIGASAERAGISHAQEEDGLVREKRVITSMLRHGISGMRGADREYAEGRILAQGMGTPTSGTGGGYTIAPLFFNELQVAMKAQGGMREVATVITTDTGANLPFPLLDDRSNVATIVSENTQITEDTELTFTQTTLGGYTYKSGVLMVSLQLLNDSAFNFDTIIRDAIAGRFVRGTNAHFTTGTGSSQPKGIVPAATAKAASATGQATAPIYGDLVDVVHSVDPFYRRGARWMLNDASMKGLRKIVDGQSRPLWQAGLADGAPDTLLGYPITFNSDVDAMAASKKSLLFGDLSKYYIRDVATSVQIMTLRERYADWLQIGVLAWCRTDGNLISAAAPVTVWTNSAT